MRNSKYTKRGSILILVTVSLTILAIMGIALMTVACGVRRQAVATKNEAAAMLAAEAGYERAIYWLSQQSDVLSALQNGTLGTSGVINLTNSYCDYGIQLFAFVGTRPVYRIISNGHSGVFGRTVDVRVAQAIGGWQSSHTVPKSATETESWPFADSETIDIPISVHKLNDSPDNRDIYLIGSPTFLQTVSIGESRYTDAGADKYAGVMDCFEAGIYFDQPENRVTDADSVQTKVDRFRDSTKAQFKFTPAATAPGITKPHPAVHLEFFVQDGAGKVRITNNCTVRGFQRTDTGTTYDYKVNPSGVPEYEKYDIYAYHLRAADADSTGQRFIYHIDDSYVTQSIGTVESEPGGQIFVDGNVIIGSGDPSLPGAQDMVKGKVAVVATGNIWIADSVIVDGAHEADGKPSMGNPNILGLIAQGVIKVVDPGMSDYSYVDDTPVEPEGFEYVPIGQRDSGQPEGSHKRHLPNPTVLEAAITVGGGGWGAENVGERKTKSWFYDELVVRGAIAEVTRGIVGTSQPLWSGWAFNGYTKHYYFDERLLQGILPGDVWLGGKYVPTPAGWHDYRSGG